MIMAQASFAAGCFWGVEQAFRRLGGVSATTVGYTGGTLSDPTYEQVCGGHSGHAEAVRVEFDPQTVTYDALLELFWGLHDPTQLDRQGPDRGSQYRSAIFFHDAEQKAAARASMTRQQASGRHRGQIVTQIVPAETFYPAEDYHQQYFEKRGRGAWHQGA